jgi:hypothetical protein
MATSRRGDRRLNVETIIADRQAVQARERALVRALDGALRRLGYRIVAAAPPTARRARARRGTSRARARKGE